MDPFVGPVAEQEVPLHQRAPLSPPQPAPLAKHHLFAIGGVRNWFTVLPCYRVRNMFSVVWFAIANTALVVAVVFCLRYGLLFVLARGGILLSGWEFSFFTM